MPISLPDGTTIPTTSIKNFVEVTELQGNDCLLGIYDLTVGSGSKITFDNLVDSLINTGSFSGTVDQVYDPTSDKAQSGVAIAGALSGYVLSANLATVATTGVYSDLTGQPTIPTVNNATITLTQGGVTKGTFTLNQNNNAIIDFNDGGGGGGAVDSVNGQTGTVVLTASDVGAITSSAIANMQTTTNLVTSVSSSSTNSQYPSAKLFYDTCGNIETAINAIRGV